MSDKPERLITRHNFDQIEVGEYVCKYCGGQLTEWPKEPKFVGPRTCTGIKPKEGDANEKPLRRTGINVSEPAEGGGRKRVACDENCGAFMDPKTLEEYMDANKHWKEHSAKWVRMTSFRDEVAHELMAAMNTGEVRYANLADAAIAVFVKRLREEADKFESHKVLRKTVADMALNIIADEIEAEAKP